MSFLVVNFVWIFDPNVVTSRTYCIFQIYVVCVLSSYEGGMGRAITDHTVDSFHKDFFSVESGSIENCDTDDHLSNKLRNQCRSEGQ